MKRYWHLPFIMVFALLSSFSLKAQDTIVLTLASVHQGNGSGLATRTVVDTFLFPHDLSGYEQINMHVILTCPTGGCDPWDRFASVQVFHDSEWFEIGRYITPYGRACGWILDVNDYRSLLTDTVIIKSFIDTWTNPGWLVSIVFDFFAGTPVYSDIKVENLWLDYNVVYGDSTQPVYIPVMSKTIDSAATEVKMKIVNTGHGQGNTNNAAEFSPKTHTLWVNGSQAASQYLWRSNCATNTCSPQGGNWQSNRAGWCPGADVLPYYGNLTALVVPGQQASLEYRLQNYFNYCNPNNANCVTGVTCADCNYNFTGHTEPHYKISGQLITYRGLPTGILTASREKSVLLSPNPSQGKFSIRLNPAFRIHRAEIFNVLGKSVFVEGNLSDGQFLDLSHLPRGIYFLKMEMNIGNQAEKIILQ